MSGINFRRLLHHRVRRLRLSAARRRVDRRITAFYGGDRTRILTAAVVSGMAVLNLLWFAAALRTTLADAGKTVGARRRPPPAQCSEGCSSCSSR